MLSRRLTLVTLTGILFWLSGCFTEIGNAEDERLLEAEFNIDPTQSPVVLRKTASGDQNEKSLTITHFTLQLVHGYYNLKDSAGFTSKKTLWVEGETEKPIDFTGKDSSAKLKTEKLENDVPDNLNFEFMLPSHGGINPETIDFETFNKLGYLKGQYGTKDSTVNFLYCMPSGKQFYLVYSQEAMKTWLSGNFYHAQITFFPYTWLKNIDLNSATRVKDKNKKDLIYIGSEYNSSIYSKLVPAFYQSFNTKVMRIQ